MMTIKECNHKGTKVTSRDQCYMGGDCSDCPQAAGGITVIEQCECGAAHDCHVNQCWSTEWSDWSDSCVFWWIKSNAWAIQSACSDRELATAWTRLLVDAAERQSREADLETIREKVRAGERITLYSRAGATA